MKSATLLATEVRAERWQTLVEKRKRRADRGRFHRAAKSPSFPRPEYRPHDFHVLLRHRLLREASDFEDVFWVSEGPEAKHSSVAELEHPTHRRRGLDPARLAAEVHYDRRAMRCRPPRARLHVGTHDLPCIVEVAHVLPDAVMTVIPASLAECHLCEERVPPAPPDRLSVDADAKRRVGRAASKTRPPAPRSPATSPAQYLAGSGVGVSVLLRQPHGFEGRGAASRKSSPDG